MYQSIVPLFYVVVFTWCPKVTFIVEIASYQACVSVTDSQGKDSNVKLTLLYQQRLSHVFLDDAVSLTPMSPSVLSIAANFNHMLPYFFIIIEHSNAITSIAWLSWFKDPQLVWLTSLLKGLELRVHFKRACGRNQVGFRHVIKHIKTICAVVTSHIDEEIWLLGNLVDSIKMVVYLVWLQLSQDPRSANLRPNQVQ